MPTPPLPAALSSECLHCRSDLDRLLAEGSAPVRFRPIAEFARGEVWGHIASVCGSPEGRLYTPRKLVTIARHVGRIEKLASVFFDGTVRQYVDAGAHGTLIFSLLEWENHCLDLPLSALLCGALARHGLPPERVAILHPGHDPRTPRQQTLAESLGAVRAAGIGLVSLNLGCECGDSGLWTQLAPDLILVDEMLLSGIEPSALHRSRVAGLIAAERGKGRLVAMSGISSLAVCRAVMEMGVTHGAGDFIGRSNLTPSTIVSAAASKLMLEQRPGGADAADGTRHVLHRLLVPVPPAAPSDTADSVFARFENDAGVSAIAVVRDDHPIGLISRFDMVENMVRPYRQELYGRKPCTRYMDAEPVIVDVRLSLPELSEVIVGAHPRHLISGFIVTEHGRYLGIGSVQDLMREVTAMQMQAARYANPLTELPGNVPINQHIDSLLAAGEWCAIAYGDLDNFKPFNDVYGFARGDAVIRLTASVLARVCDPEYDFLGHIGGDDFIIVFRSRDWQARCQQALDAFAGEIREFFSEDDIELGGYVTENRKGQPEFHAITSLSIGIVDAAPGMFANHLSIARVAAEVKKKAKAIVGNSLYTNLRTYTHGEETEIM
ncbi:EAL domain-containing protein [Rhodocyclus tenuis]|uniref:EAL domain-containing protein n=1 Tax=Rhodocyclus gracilis TaxID=2929842 RepID=UPI001298A61D|nr:EAL domain-containing protein [Rhodocyclus gracilis]MRD72964.1 EAL domain-containing protein [Rhodocyclus gracilis]